MTRFLYRCHVVILTYAVSYGLSLSKKVLINNKQSMPSTDLIGSAVRADFRRLYPANAKTPTCCPSDDNRTKVTNSVTSARSLWWHVGPYFWPADLTRTANPIKRIRSYTNMVDESIKFTACLGSPRIHRLLTVLRLTKEFFPT